MAAEEQRATAQSGDARCTCQGSPNGERRLALVGSQNLSRVRVRDPVPFFRDGLAQSLREHGFDVVAVDEPNEPISADSDLTLHGIVVEEDWEALARHAEETLVIAVPPADVELMTAWRHGAVTSISRSAAVEDFVAHIEAICRGRVLLDLKTLAEVRERFTAPAALSLSETEKLWLRIIDGGATVEGVAQQVGQSERSMQRLMSALYKRMKVKGLPQAMGKAGRSGMLD